MESSYLITIVIVSVMLTIGAILLLRVVRGMNRKMEPVARALGGEVKNGILAGTYVKLHREGLEYRAGILATTNKTPPFLYVQVMVAPDFDLFIFKESALTRTLGDMGVMQDLKIGDEPDSHHSIQRSISEWS